MSGNYLAQDTRALACASPEIAADVQAPALYMTTIGHTRLRPLRHAFRYRHPMWLLDLTQLTERPLPGLLGRAVSFEARDHMGDPSRSIRENLVEWVGTHGVDVTTDRVVMLTNGRSCGYVFNPLTVFWCLRPGGSVHCVIAEVHNTYGGRHCYLLVPDDIGRASVGKAFHVSPFNDVDGEYHMRLSRPVERVKLAVSLWHDGRAIFSATLSGRRRPATARVVARAVGRYPLASLRASALIRYQGVRIRLRGLPVVRRQV
jgi:uncharacterized protein